MNFFLEVTTFLAPFGTRAIGEISVVILKIKKSKLLSRKLTEMPQRLASSVLKVYTVFPDISVQYLKSVSK